MPSILFVCTANICRSPMAEAILKRLVATRQDAGKWRIESAGVMATHGSHAAPISQLVMKSMGIDISSHVSQPVSKEFLLRFDVILVMETWHKEALKVQFEELADRMYLLSEMVGISKEISDPIGGELVDYQETAYEMERILSSGLDRMVQIASERH